MTTFHPHYPLFPPPPGLQDSPTSVQQQSTLPTISSILQSGDNNSQPLARQYAHPLPRRTSYRSTVLDLEDGLERSSENMLRRKTPNGVLASAYDGTSVEELDKPRASKHIILPVTAAMSLASLPFRMADPSNGFGTAQQRQQEQLRADWSASLYFGMGSGRGLDGWQAIGQAVPQIDSMLNQMTPLQPYTHYGAPFCIAGAPSLHSFGPPPTVSNDQGPYGPYWHDGTYIPYRPAALRDSRFIPHPQHQHAHLHPYSHSLHDQQAHAGSHWRSFPNPNHPTNNHPQLQHHTYNSQLLQPPPHSYSLPPPRLPHNALPDPHGRPPYATPVHSQHPQDRIPATAYLPAASATRSVSAALVDFTTHPENTQNRDRMFAWAHRVYVELLEYLKCTRKPSSSSRTSQGYQAPRPHIYPRPPRQVSSASLSALDELPASSTVEHQLQDHLPSHRHSSSLHAYVSGNGHDSNGAPLQSPQPPHGTGSLLQGLVQPPRPLRRMSGTSVATTNQSLRSEQPLPVIAATALNLITKHCEDSNWKWIDGILLGGCLAYALGHYQTAQQWYKHILLLDRDHVEAVSNLAATFFALHQRRDAEEHWRRAVKLRPSFFEAVEHLIGLLCGDNRGRDAVQIIDEVEHSLKLPRKRGSTTNADVLSERSNSVAKSPSISEVSDRPFFEQEGDQEPLPRLDDFPGSDQPGFGSSGYAIPGSDNGRMLSLVHAKGNMLYALGDNAGAAKAFESAVLIAVGQEYQSLDVLITRILSVVGYAPTDRSPGGRRVVPSSDPVLLYPEHAQKTAQLCFPSQGALPGLQYVLNVGPARKAAISTTSNSLLSLAKIFQDGMATNSPKASVFQTVYGVRDILALYYLSLSLQPSPSTANNVGILLASVQQSAPSRTLQALGIPVTNHPDIPGLVPGSGISLALHYYYFGLSLDHNHAHLFTNLGSLLKDIGHLDWAINMYEKAVACDGNFDIALANLANAMKDKGRIQDAIIYYKRAVQASPEFAEAVCGLANALNSVCDWKGRGGIAADHGARDRWHVNDSGMLLDAREPGASSSGWIKRVVDLVEKQLADGEDWGRGIMDDQFVNGIRQPLLLEEGTPDDIGAKTASLMTALANVRCQKWEGARLVRLVERATRRITWQWYHDRRYNKQRPPGSYRRPQLPAALTVPAAPTVLPFHTFTCPMSAKQIRLISQRNGLRISCSTLKAPWLPRNVYRPPPPPAPYLNVGYVSSDFNNHPLAHLMQSVFGLHDKNRVKAFCYATTASDGSIHRQQIEREAPVFYDASSWSAEALVNRIVNDQIHILVNLNGYTRGARNEVFAARPAPIQMSFMGFAGTLGAEWCDYLLADDTAVPTDTLREWRRNVDLEDAVIDENSGGTADDWIYGENIIFCRNTFFCCDHRQSAPDSQGPQLNWDKEQHRRWAMRKEIFPHLPDDAIILGNFNQLYKIEPTTFRTWLRILQRLPNAILWLLRFPDLGESKLKETAMKWGGAEVASRVIFTDIAQKHQHIARARVLDLFLDTPECNAHTTAADVLWSGTPLLTLPRYKYKMCSRMAASILKGALPNNEIGMRAAQDLVARDDEDYEEKAVRLGKDCIYRGHKAEGRLSELRRILYEERWTSALFDTKRWVRDLEEAYGIAWKKWERAEGGDIWLQPQRRF
ncbi:glycosyltransferase family 41 protein [Sporormia fimetaria CBS 119925]|uniref:protein O-GlcNAc transferase n=1 Tax=Sporormia fimetaria CBS 119925 TaxID=1340428 RepID=A0A6A6V319_9PLEO|nr:glycosyltransferase family 41 protein [Sporormia fimetaria CBS 119925]